MRLFLPVAKKEVPPGLPEVLRGRFFLRGRVARLILVVCIGDDDDVFAGTGVAQLLARLALNFVGILIVAGLLLQVCMLVLELLSYLLLALQALHKLTV